MADSLSEASLGETWPPWERLVTAIQNHLGIPMSEEGTRKLRYAFFAVGVKNQEDFVSAVFLEALEARTRAETLSEADVIRAGWRVGKRIHREANKALTVDPYILNKTNQRRVSPSATAPTTSLEAIEVLDFAKRLDPVGATLLVMWLEGETLSEIANRSGLPITTVWERLKLVKTELKEHFRVDTAP